MIGIEECFLQGASGKLASCTTKPNLGKKSNRREWSGRLDHLCVFLLEFILCCLTWLEGSGRNDRSSKLV